MSTMSSSAGGGSAAVGTDDVHIQVDGQVAKVTNRRKPHEVVTIHFSDTAEPKIEVTKK